MNRPALILAPLLLALHGCTLLGPDRPQEHAAVIVPAGFEPAPEPAHNPLTAQKVALGERLFFEPALSGDGTVSCASCHLPERAFADNHRISPGVGGRLGIRNTPSLVNVAYQRLLFWDGGALTLESQVVGPLENPAEMDASLAQVLEDLSADPTYARDFEAAFGEGPSVRTFTQALAAYQRTLVSGGSRYDRAVAGRAPLSAQEQRGLDLFRGSAGCQSCHAGFLFTTQDFENNGIGPGPAGSLPGSGPPSPGLTQPPPGPMLPPPGSPQPPGGSGPPSPASPNLAPPDSGRARITLDPADAGRFKVPSLRNVAVTAPYMHDGRFASLRDVIDHYNRGGDGSPGQSPKIHPLGLSERDIDDLLAFLASLTDEQVRSGLGS